MLIDDVAIKVCSGHGGKGKAAFNKNALSLGPAGGSGGNGGSIYIEIYEVEPRKIEFVFQIFRIPLSS